jgi:hypothetical protein
MSKGMDRKKEEKKKPGQDFGRKARREEGKEGGPGLGLSPSGRPVLQTTRERRPPFR